MGFSRSTGSCGKEETRRVLLSDLEDHHQCGHHITRGKKECFQGFLHSPGQLGVLNPPFVPLPWLCSPEQGLNSSDLPSCPVPGVQATPSGVSETNIRVGRVMRHILKSALLLWREQPIGGEGWNWSESPQVQVGL